MDGRKNEGTSRRYTCAGSTDHNILIWCYWYGLVSVYLPVSSFVSRWVCSVTSRTELKALSKVVRRAWVVTSL